MLAFIKKVYRSLRYRLIIKPIAIYDDFIMSIGKTKFDEFLNAGERFDPKIAKMMKWSDPCHIKRYEFAKLFINKNDTVLDIACGTGYGSKIISPICQHLVGVDISSQAIQYANDNYKTFKSSFLTIDFFENQYIADVVISFETIEHIRCNSIHDVLLQLLSYCKNTLVGSVPFKELQGNNPYHYFFELDEVNLSFLGRFGRIVFYYQSPDGQIHKNNNNECDIQNLIFVLHKNQ